MTSKSRLLSSVVNKPESLIGASLSQPNEVNLQALETAATQYTDVTTLPASGYVGEQAFVASTNRLYIWTGTGWFNIALVNTDPTISSAGAANYTMSYGTPITVNVDASDPEGLGLSYSYYTSDSIGSVATITNDSSQFTITPSSDYSIEGSFGLVFRASDGPNIASSSSSTFTLTNQAPSLSGNSGSYVLATDGSTPTVITLTSVDPEGQPITYTATGDSGFNAIATVSNDSSVFTIIPKSEDSAVSGTGSLTFTVSDGIKSTNATSSFTLNFISIIENSKYTTLLASAVGTSDNNNITDASTNNHSITVNGDAHAGTFSPYRSGGYSTKVTVNDGFTFADHTDFQFGTGEFTIDFWYKKTIDQSGFGVILRSSSGSFMLATYQNKISFHNGINVQVQSATLDLGEWYHVAITRNSSNDMYIWLNGVPSTAWNAGTQNFNASGTWELLHRGSFSESVTGEFSNFRIVKGTSLYTSNFSSSLPIERTVSVSGSGYSTSLLMNDIMAIDDGPTAHSLTAVGSPKSIPSSPYDYTEYSATDHGGSVYFDGSGDYLSISNPLSLTGDFTVSAWVYPEGTSKVQVVASPDLSPNNQFFIDANNFMGTYDGNTTNNAQGVGVKRNSWNYLVWSRTGSSLNMYVNGQQASNSPSSTNTYNLQRIGILASANGPMLGYISDLQIKTSSTSAANAVPPTAPLSSSGAELHIKGTDASIIDKSQGSNLKLEGDIDNGWGLDKFITSQQAVEFNGSAQYLTVAGNSDFDFGSNDFTVEAWVYTDSSDEQVITSGRSSGSSWIFLNKTTSNTIRILISTDGSNWAVNSISTETMTLSRWNHISVSRDGSTINMYLNGRLIISTSISGSTHYNTSEKIAIGSGLNNSSDRGWNGYISDFRIINGTAVVPPVNGPDEALTEVTNTKLLTCRPSGASITDLSTTGTTHTIVSVGSTAAAYASPFGKAMYFDGSGDEINGGRSIIPVGFSDFTVEGWVNFSNVSGQQFICIQAPDGGTTTTTFMIYLANSKIYNQWGSGSAYIETGILSANTWYHFASVHDSANSLVYFYLDGSSVGSFSSGSRSIGDYVFDIGARDSALFLNGYLQDLRVSNYNRYSANFTPPTAPLEG